MLLPRCVDPLQAEARSAIAAHYRALAEASQQLRERLDSDQADLTQARIALLQEVARGLRNKAIAATLPIPEKTGKVHIRHRLPKLAGRSRGAATVLWLAPRVNTLKKLRRYLHFLHNLSTIL